MIKILQPISLKATATSVKMVNHLLEATHHDFWLETQSAQTLTCQPPLDIGTTPSENQLFFGSPAAQPNKSYTFPAGYIAALPHSRLVGEGYVVMSGRNEVITESFSGDQVLQNGGHFLRQQLKIDLGGGQQAVPFILFRTQNPPRLIDQTCLLPTHYWHFNYHHWLIECMPRLRLALEEPAFANCPVIVPATLSPFQKETMQLLGLSADRLLPFNGGDWQFRNLIFPSIGTFAPQELRWVRNKFLAAIEARGNADGLYYITRRDTTNRQVINEDEVATFLQKQGFQIITLTELSFSKQLELFASARVVIGPHGAGLTNMLFAPSTATLIELIPDDQVNHCFWLIANAVGHRYTFLAGQTMNAQRDFTVSLERLRQALRMI
ncbi:MAG: glycosyltransferase family 61 protein [Chloroflexota bacterium]